MSDRIELDQDKQPMASLMFNVITKAREDVEASTDPAIHRLYALAGYAMTAIAALEAQINMGYPRPMYETDPDLAGPSGAHQVPVSEIPAERYGPLHVRLLEVERRLDDLG